MNMTSPNNFEASPNEWDNFCLGLLRKDTEEAVELLSEKLEIGAEKLAPIRDLVRDTAVSLSDGNVVDEDKVRRRFGLEYGLLSPSERELLRAEVTKKLPIMFDECERAKLPLAALVGYGSIFDLRMGLSDSSDLDLRVISLGDQEHGIRACWKLNEEYSGAEIYGHVFPRVDAHSDWLTGEWLENNIANPRKVIRVQETFDYMKPGSVVFVRNIKWKNLLEKAVDFSSKGIVVEVLGLE